MTLEINTLPGNLTVRPTTLEVVPAITELIRACEIALDGTAETTLEDMQTYFQMPDIDLATDTLSVFDGSRLVGGVAVDHRQHSRISAEVAVDPDYQNQAIEEYLLNWAEQRAHQHIVLAEPGVRVTLNTRASSKDNLLPRLYEKHGFQQVRSFWRMLIEMDAQPEPAQWPAGITVRTATPDLFHAIYEADEEAFQDHWGHMPHSYEEWEHWGVNRQNFDPTLWFLAMDGEQIAGLSLCAIEQGDNGWVHDLAIRRPWRRRGLGLALLRHSFGEFYRRGLRDVYLGVDAQSLTGAVRLYERAGMHVVRQFNRYEKELRAGKELSTQTVDG
ncbi:MAG: GNAT family N-acetyltransferase [Ktedonobacteraceae bacterium]|nr:GNAT family N-acetyltransferase [Ktedonobacteraceae bacterium]